MKAKGELKMDIVESFKQSCTKFSEMQEGNPSLLKNPLNYKYLPASYTAQIPPAGVKSIKLNK
jgi:hypothetical protein